MKEVNVDSKMSANKDEKMSLDENYRYGWKKWVWMECVDEENECPKKKMSLKTILYKKVIKKNYEWEEFSSLNLDL